MRHCTTLFLAIGLLLIARSGSAQQHDYPRYPKTDFTIEHLEAALEINEQKQIKGDVTYSIRWIIGGADSLLLDAERIQIDDVLLNERTMDYAFNDNKLTIYFNETFNRNDTATLRLLYSADPTFGIHSNYSGTVFTSLLPLSTNHWLPVLDHPGMAMTTDITVTHPSSRTLIMSGRKTGNSVVSVEQEQTRYESRYPIPVTALFFAIGAFQPDSRTIDNVRYNLFAEQPNGADFDLYSIQKSAAETVQQMEEITGVDYPYSDLHVVMMDDLVWETRTFGAGTILVDLSHSVEQQVRYGVAAQWAGVITRNMSWSDPYAVQLMQGYFARELNLEPSPADSLLPWDSLYKAVSQDNIHRFTHYLAMHPQLDSLMPVVFPEIFNEEYQPVTWQSFAQMIYKNSGQPFMEEPEFKFPDDQEASSYNYTATITQKETEGEAVVEFKAKDRVLEELVSVEVTLFSFDGVEREELSFTGSSDKIVLTVPASIENISLEVKDRQDVTLVVEKPFMFWIYQLRNAEQANERKEAAIRLQAYSDNPDLQLALLDFIESESDPGVAAEIIKTLSAVTDGASGTSQLFLERTGTENPKPLRLAAVQALSAYNGYDRVISTLRSIIRSGGSADIRKEAIRSLASVTDLERYSTITESIVLEESVLYEVPLILNQLAEMGGAEKAAQLSENFVSSEFPFEVRGSVLRLLLEIDSSQQGWDNRVDQLIADSDPRIRYLAVDALMYLPGERAEEITGRRLSEEFDFRVFKRLQRNE